MPHHRPYPQRQACPFLTLAPTWCRLQAHHGRDATILDHVEASTSTGHTGQSLPPQDARMSGGVSLVSVVSPAFLVTVNSISRAGSKIWRRRGPRVGTPLRCTGVSTSVSRHFHFSQGDMVCQMPSHRYASCYFSSQSRNGWHLGLTFTSWHPALSWNISQGGRHCVCLEDAISAEDPRYFESPPFWPPFVPVDEVYQRFDPG